MDYNSSNSYRYVNHITETWRTKIPKTPGYTQTQAFSYDGLGRLRDMQSPSMDLSETLDVDLNADVLGVTRSYRGATVQDAVIDMDGMLPTAVRDVSSPYYQDAVGRFLPGDYILSHDRCGRLTVDSSRGVSSVTYHPWGNLPRTISLDDKQSISNRYLPDGTLLSRNFRTKRIDTHIKVDQNGDTIVKNLDLTQWLFRCINQCN